MATVVYSSIAINARLNGVLSVIGSSGYLLLKQGVTTLSAIVLASPAGVVSAGVLTFYTGVDMSAPATGTVDTAIITNNSGSTIISGLTVGIPLSGAEVIISNGLNSKVISSGQTVALLGGQITGS